MMAGAAHVPSVELKTVEFILGASEAPASRAVHLRHHGFRVSLEYEPELSVPGVGTFKDVLVITDVYVPPRYRRYGWFRAYLKLCGLLCGEALIVDELYGPVRDALIGYGFVPVPGDAVMLSKHSPLNASWRPRWHT
ncbi:hypothetical protein dqs_1056 [Azoarcus olearius]|uniref:hypothetical protein n=1 Tax=Azoarcus sp. (strain BH72) TaxID=418699 RepID=UPI0008060E78|nr:hypothetical protein [Azoarcus olearius]ANQ84120.1 hypothetical protein dqs_1056 [Azoarcus olearius]